MSYKEAGLHSAEKNNKLLNQERSPVLEENSPVSIKKGRLGKREWKCRTSYRLRKRPAVEVTGKEMN